MKEYKNLRSALTICPVELGLSEEGYKNRFITFIKNSGPSYSKKIRDEFYQALGDPDWSWKKAAKEALYYAYDEKDSEESVLKNIKWLLSDILI
jgi:hypothetical protein